MQAEEQWYIRWAGVRWAATTCADNFSEHSLYSKQYADGICNMLPNNVPAIFPAASHCMLYCEKEREILKRAHDNRAHPL